MTRPAIFFDRDGVLNQAIVLNGQPHSPRSIEEVCIIPGMKDCLSNLRSQGYLLIGITNQPDVARGYVSQDTATSINRFIASQVGLDAIYCCFHDSKHECSCRKPKAGLFLQAQSEWAIAFNRSFVVGDRWKDIEAARNAQIASIFIDYDYQETKPSHQQRSVHTPIQACQYILSQLISQAS